MTNKHKTKPRKTTRVYYGTGKVKLYWTVRVHDAKKNVEMNGSLMDAINGTAGETIGCHLSNCAKGNASAFPHPCILPAFNRGTCIVIDKVTNGSPSHGFRYIHNYGRLVDLNDTDKTRAPECRYCKAGNVANEKGDHWIVKSIIPAKIDIRKCTAGKEPKPALRVELK